MRRATMVVLLLALCPAVPARAVWPFTDTYDSNGFGCVTVTTKGIKYIARRAVKSRLSGRVVLTLEKYSDMPPLADLMTGKRGRPVRTREVELASHYTLAVWKEESDPLVSARKVRPDACVCRTLSRCISE
jgi:hypothetical protein